LTNAAFFLLCKKLEVLTNFNLHLKGIMCLEVIISIWISSQKAIDSGKKECLVILLFSFILFLAKGNTL
jgi:hypothetical protein